MKIRGKKIEFFLSVSVIERRVEKNTDPCL